MTNLSKDLQCSSSIKSVVLPDAHSKFREPLSSAKACPENLTERQLDRPSGKHILRKLRKKVLRSSVLGGRGMVVNHSAMQLRTKQMLF